MAKQPRLTDEQKVKLHEFEPALKAAVRRGDYRAARQLTANIQNVLRPTGHETRLMKAKNWLFEAALEAGKLQTAISGLSGVRQKTSPRTRIYLEATALMAIAHLRRCDVASARPFIVETMERTDKIIRSERRRRQFRKRYVERFEEEIALAAVRGQGTDALEPEEIELEAGKLLAAHTEDELLKRLGRALPPSVELKVLEVDELSKAALPPAEVRYLPSAETIKQERELGRKFFQPLKRVIWRTLCDPESENRKLWVEQGLGTLMSKTVIGTAVATAFVDFGIGLKALAVPAAALIFKMGVDVFCEIAKPQTIMIGLDERD